MQRKCAELTKPGAHLTVAPKITKALRRSDLGGYVVINKLPDPKTPRIVSTWGRTLLSQQ